MSHISYKELLVEKGTLNMDGYLLSGEVLSLFFLFVINGRIATFRGIDSRSFRMDDV